MEPIDYFPAGKKDEISTKGFLFIGIIATVLGIYFHLMYGNSALDIQLHDTYIVTSFDQIFYNIAMYAFSCFGIYQIFTKIFKVHLSKISGQIHLGIYLCFLVVLAVFIYHVYMTRHAMLIDNINAYTANQSVYYLILPFLVILFVILQLFFIFNLIFGMYKKMIR